nr:glycosyltransferase [Deltaproteobacteria bacterium]
MYREKKICVVVPAHNEEVLIVRTVETMPNFVDCIVVIDDASTDRT